MFKRNETTKRVCVCGTPEGADYSTPSRRLYRPARRVRRTQNLPNGSGSGARVPPSPQRSRPESSVLAIVSVRQDGIGHHHRPPRALSRRPVLPRARCAGALRVGARAAAQQPRRRLLRRAADNARRRSCLLRHIRRRRRQRRALAHLRGLGARAGRRAALPHGRHAAAGRGLPLRRRAPAEGLAARRARRAQVRRRARLLLLARRRLS